MAKTSLDDIIECVRPPLEVVIGKPRVWYRRHRSVLDRNSNLNFVVLEAKTNITGPNSQIKGSKSGRLGVGGCSWCGTAVVAVTVVHISSSVRTYMILYMFILRIVLSLNQCLISA